MTNYMGELSNSPVQWFDFIIAETKKFEGRIKRGGNDKWSLIKEGDTITFTCKDDARVCKTRVQSVREYPDFGTAFDALGSELIPIEGITKEGAVAMYAALPRRTEDMGKPSVVFELELIKD